MSFYLYLMRHAKSDWSGANTSDFDRPINKRGQKNARQIGQWMKQNGYIPAHIISSSAIRAKQTTELLSAEIQDLNPVEIKYEKALYLADMDTLLDFINAYKEKSASLMLVAHNPGMENLLMYLARNSAKFEERDLSMTTANLAIFEYASADFDPGQDKGKLLEFIKPRELG